MKKSGTKRRKRFELLGGELCLDFMNTIGWRNTPREIEFIPEWRDLVAWVEQAAYLPPGRLQRISAALEASSRSGPVLLRQAKLLRRALDRIFFALIGRRAVRDSDLEILNRYLRPGMARLGIARARSSFQWESRPADSSADALLWPIAKSAADLLTSGRWSRVRACGDAECGWVFLDTTKNSRRAWCAMRICGNRHKARRHRASRKTPAD